MQASCDFEFINPVIEEVQGYHFYHIPFGGDQLTAARARDGHNVMESEL